MKRQPDTRPALERIVSFVEDVCVTPAKRRPVDTADAYAALDDLHRLRRLERLHKAGDGGIDYALLDAAIDCGDGSCMFAANTGGLRTQGGCRCIERARPGVASVLARYVSENRRMRVELAAMREAAVVRGGEGAP